LLNLISLSPPPLCVLFGFGAGWLTLRYEMVLGFYFPKDTTHLYHSLKATQQRFLRFTFLN
jgi:hypothetical protein